MTRMIRVAAVFLFVIAVGKICWGGEAKKNPAYTDPANAGADFAFQGEYVGKVTKGDGDVKFGVQIVALGGGKFRGLGYEGGLPGDGWEQSRGTDPHPHDGELKGGAVVFRLPGEATVIVRDGQITVKEGDKTIATFKKVERKSPTLGAKPPAGAVVLFDGTSAEKFQNGRMTKDGLLMEGATSKQKFGSSISHIELLPFQPYDRGQGRANSGYYVQGRYEVQILDSFGLEGLDNECGGLYRMAKPIVNMCYPPLSWQTYDVDFTAAEFKDGKKIKNARLTVRHNGVLIQDNTELPGTTFGAITKESPEPGPIYLQNHGNPVRFRNIWVVEK